MMYEKWRRCEMKKVVGILIAVVIALVLGFVPLVETPYIVTVQYLETETYYEWVPNPWVISELERTGAAVGQLYNKVERERVVIKEREETRYKKVPIFEYLRSRF
jgi:hypothetical protein